MALIGKQAGILGAKPKVLPKKLKKAAPPAPQGSGAAPPKPPLKAGMLGKLKGAKPA
jgi:hypothetical protein